MIYDFKELINILMTNTNYVRIERLMSIHWKPNYPEWLEMCIERDLVRKRRFWRLEKSIKNSHRKGKKLCWRDTSVILEKRYAVELDRSLQRLIPERDNHRSGTLKQNQVVTLFSRKEKYFSICQMYCQSTFKKIAFM